jgi:hypothetical protein
VVALSKRQYHISEIFGTFSYLNVAARASMVSFKDTFKGLIIFKATHTRDGTYCTFARFMPQTLSMGR